MQHAMFTHYGNSYSYRPYYSPDYGRYNRTYETGGAAGQ